MAFGNAFFGAWTSSESRGEDGHDAGTSEADERYATHGHPYDSYERYATNRYTLFESEVPLLFPAL